MAHNFHRLSTPLSRRLSSSSFSIDATTTTTKGKVPLLYKSPEFNQDTQKEAVTLQVLSWGRGASGQLGGGIEEIRIYPSPVANLLFPPASFSLSPTPGKILNQRQNQIQKGETLPSVGISCGLFHSGLVVDGKLWMWGKGDGGRLGFGHENPAFLPTLNPYLDSVSSVALGGLHSVALTSLGEVFTWGYGGFGALGHHVYHRELIPRLLEGNWSENICHISTSGTHTAAITESGDLYTWGREEGDGRLGLGPGRGPNEGGGLSIPSKVKELPTPIAAVSCGGFFTMALTEEGQLWNWGANSNYELGTGDKVGGWKPKPLPTLESTRIIQIASGGYHSLALTCEGKVFSWGHGGHGQLGHSSIQNQKIPVMIEALADKHVVDIACGGSSSAAITEEGKLYMWGNAKDSQLGVPGLPEVQPSPVEVNFLTEDDGLGPHNVLSVAVGACHAMCLVLRSHC
ncbi:Regulator of chromosome condensation family protein isoform 1 [Theobroma cacao]|uniref:Regulator of chromosome condensation family protein isoform 1 n=1 Tax=Theobroma cacao TaxID=3641 RepID=A0A061DKP5_THECC|nr:Regulator of chromosome condensation family protein isoform 1 [Theobroma cacao]